MNEEANAVHYDSSTVGDASQVPANAFQRVRLVGRTVDFGFFWMME